MDQLICNMQPQHTFIPDTLSVFTSMEDMNRSAMMLMPRNM